MKRIRVGVIGCGVIAQIMHLQFLRELRDQFEITALCDLNPVLLEEVGNRFGVVTRFDKWEDLIAAPIDLVMILSSGDHAPVVLAAAAAGKNIFVEKPMALSSVDGQKIADAVAAAGVTLMVGYMKRYDAAYERCRDEVTKFSELRLARTLTLESPFEPYVTHYGLTHPAPPPADVFAALDAEYGKFSASQSSRRSFDGPDQSSDSPSTPESVAKKVYSGVLLQSMIHDINAIRGVLGEPESLDSAQLTSTTVQVSLTFSGVPATMSWVDLRPGMARYRQEFSFYGPDKRATLLLPSPYLRNMPIELVIESGDRAGQASQATHITSSFDAAFRRELIDLHACITKGKTPRTDATDGMRDIALCEAIVTVALTGKPLLAPTAAARSIAPGS